MANYSMENDSTQKEHLKASNTEGKYNNMEKHITAEALRRFRTEPYQLTAQRKMKRLEELKKELNDEIEMYQTEYDTCKRCHHHMDVTADYCEGCGNYGYIEEHELRIEQIRRDIKEMEGKK